MQHVEQCVTTSFEIQTLLTVAATLQGGNCFGARLPPLVLFNLSICMFILVGLLHTVPFMLNVKHGSCEYQFLNLLV